MELEGTQGFTEAVRPSAGMGRVERRRARTRERILQVAEALVRSRGIEAVTIDEITEAADIARGSFYHHFESKHDVLVPIARAHTKSLNRCIDRLIENRSDPAEIASIALRHTLRGILADPLCCWFIMKSGLPHNRLREGIGESAARDLERGVSTGRFAIPNPVVLADMVSGAVVGILSAYLAGSLTEADLDDAVEYVLRLLGLPPAEAREITHRPLPPLPFDPERKPPPTSQGLSINTRSPFDKLRVSGKSSIKSDLDPLALSLSKRAAGENRQSPQSKPRKRKKP